VQEASTDDRQCVNATSTPSPFAQEHVTTSLPPPTSTQKLASDPIHELLTDENQYTTAVSTSPSPSQEHITTSPPVLPDKPLTQELSTDNQQCVNATRTPFLSNQEHVPTSRSSPLRILKPPEKLHPTLSCWIKNMNKLSSLIDRLQELASSAPAQHRYQLLRQVEALRATSKKQQAHFTEFLHLSEEYANRYLLDISPEIQQQSSFLEKLERRLETAKRLRGEAVGLKTLYESRTVATMDELRATGRAASYRLQRQMIETLIFSTFATASRGRSLVQRGGLGAD
jgi:hypothetical protein